MPTTTAPAAASRRATSASSLGTRSSNTLLAAVVRTPAVSMLSLSAIGMPCSGRAGADAGAGVERLRPSQRLLAGDGDEGVEFRVVGVDALETGGHEFHRRDALAGNRGGSLGERQPGKVGGSRRALDGSQARRTGQRGAGNEGGGEGSAGERRHGAHLTPGTPLRRRDQRRRPASSRFASALNRVSSGVHSGSSGAAIAASSAVRASAGRSSSISVSAEEEQRDDAVGLVGECLAQVLFGLAQVAAEQPRHLEIPTAQRRDRAIRRGKRGSGAGRFRGPRGSASGNGYPVAAHVRRRARPCWRQSRSARRARPDWQ